MEDKVSSQNYKSLDDLVNKALIEGSELLSNLPLKKRINEATKFLIDFLDKLISVIEDNIEEDGGKKKEIAIYVFTLVYTTLAAQFLPLWLVPIGKAVKVLVISIIIPHLIDWMVRKLNERRAKKNDSEVQ